MNAFSNLQLDTNEITEEEAASAKASRFVQRPAKTSKPTASGPLYLDIETIPDFDRQHLFGLGGEEIYPEDVEFPEPSEVLEKSVKDIKQFLADYFACIDAWPIYLDQLRHCEKHRLKPRSGVLNEIESIQKKIDNAKADRLKKMSVTPEYCSIVAIGWAVDCESVVSLVVTDYQTEEMLLEAFWYQVQQFAPICGYNVSGFDLPALFARSAILGVPASRIIDTTPWKGDVLDLMKLRFPRDKAMPLKHLAPLYGIDIPAGDTDGSQVLQLWKEGRTDEIKQYVESDVEITRELHRAMAGYWCV